MSLDAPHKSKARYFKVFKVVELRDDRYFPITKVHTFYTKDYNYGWEIGKTYQAGTIIPVMNGYDLLVNGNGWDKKLGYSPSYHAYQKYEYAHTFQSRMEEFDKLPWNEKKEYRIARAIFSGSLYKMNMKRHPIGTMPEIAGSKMRIIEVFPYQQGKDVKEDLFIWNPIAEIMSKPKTDGLPPLVE